MASPDQERLDAISESVVRMIKRQDELESRVRQLESAAVFKVAPQATSPPQPPPLPKPEFAAQPGSSGFLGLGPPALPIVTPPTPPPFQAIGLDAPPPAPEAAPKFEAQPHLKTQPHLETQVGLNWINRIAV